MTEAVQTTDARTATNHQPADRTTVTAVEDAAAAVQGAFDRRADLLVSTDYEQVSLEDRTVSGIGLSVTLKFLSLSADEEAVDRARRYLKNEGLRVAGCVTEQTGTETIVRVRATSWDARATRPVTREALRKWHIEPSPDL